MEGLRVGKENVIPSPLRTLVPRRLVGALGVLLSCLVLVQPSMAGLFWASLPKGKEVEDPDLLRLFEPEFPYEAIRVVETDEGRRYVVIKAKRKITPDERLAYELKTLQGRGVFIHREWSPRSGNLMLAEMRFYRKVSDVPFVVEYSEVRGEKLKRQLASPSEDVVRREGRYMVVVVSRDFGRPGVRLMVYPEGDAPCPDPPFVGRYPNSRKLSCREKDGKVLFLMATEDRAEDVYAWYRDRLLEHYDQMGVDYPERRWKYGDSGYGIKIENIELADLKDHLRLSQVSGEVPRVVPQDGFLSNIVIFIAKPRAVAGDRVIIKISYTANRELAEKEKARFSKKPN